MPLEPSVRLGPSEIVAAIGAGGKVQISAKGGSQARWRHDGKEIFFVALDGKLKAASVRYKDTVLQAGAATSLFETRADEWDSMATYAAMPDGECFVMVEREFPHPSLCC